MITPEDDKLEVGDQTNDDEYQHVDVPLEPKVQQYLSMRQGIDTDIQLISEIGLTLSIEAEIHLAGDHPPCAACDLIVSQAYADF